MLRRDIPRVGLLIAVSAVLAAAQPTVAPGPAVNAALARARDPGIVTLIRHTSAPGTGDPAGFSLDDCATQRNLSAQGRREAVQLGAALRAVGVRDADVRSSQWCRCLETARLLDVGRVQAAAYLNSFFAGRGDQAAATRALRAAVLQKIDSRRPTLLVTHQVNITALTGVVPAEGEVVFVRATAAGTIDLVDRATPAGVP